MAALKDAFHRQTQIRQEESAGLDQQLARLEDEIRKLKIEFDVYFNSGLKRPPLELRARVEANLKRLADDRNLTFAQRYQLNSTVSRFNSYRELWRRLLKKRGDEVG